MPTCVEMGKDERHHGDMIDAVLYGLELWNGRWVTTSVRAFEGEGDKVGSRVVALSSFRWWGSKYVAE